jgi:hypothetical protein
MTTVAIMQPAYIPWCGYFDLLDQADVFVLLDTVPISKQSWQTRNRVRARHNDILWLSVPTHSHIGQPLNQVKIDNSRDWQTKHWRTIKAAYEHAHHFPHASACFLNISRAFDCTILTQLTTKMIREIAMMLGTTTSIITASSLARQRHDRIGRLADILHSTAATEFLQTAGGRENLDGRTDIEGTPIRYHEYEHPVYDQGGAEFMPHLSVIDLLAWHGPASLEIIRSGRI